jgi:predicted acyl esterase
VAVEAYRHETLLAECRRVELHRKTDSSSVDCRSPQTTGLCAGDWCDFGITGQAPHDQRTDDGRSLTFDADPLTQRLKFSARRSSLELTADQPAGLIAIRLNDVAPDGASTRVTYGVLNLTHRVSHEHPEGSSRENARA